MRSVERGGGGGGGGEGERGRIKIRCILVPMRAIRLSSWTVRSVDSSN